MLKHRLLRVAVQELAEEIGGAAEVEDVLAELESESHRGAAPAKPQSSRPFVSHSDAGRVPCGRSGQATASDARRVAWSCGCQDWCFLANASVSPWTWTAWRAGT